MSGNTTRLGIDLVQPDAAAGMAALVLSCFVVGAVAGTLLRAAAGTALCLPVLLLAEAGLLAMAAGLHDAAPGAAAAPLAIAMGLQNLARQGVAGAQTGATFVTGTLVGLGQALAEAAMGHPRFAAAVHACAWAALLAGSAAGAAGVAWLGTRTSLALPVVALLVLAALVTLPAGRSRG